MKQGLIAAVAVLALAGASRAQERAPELPNLSLAQIRKMKFPALELKKDATQAGPASAESEPQDGNFVVGTMGSDMHVNRGMLPVTLELGGKSAGGYLMATGALAASKGVGGGFVVSPLAGLKYPLKPVVGYRAFRTSGGGYANDNEDPYEIRVYHGPSIGFLSRINDQADILVQAVYAQRTVTVHDYNSDRQIGPEQRSKGWSFLAGFVFNVKGD